MFVWGISPFIPGWLSGWCVTSRAVDLGFAYQLGHTKDHHQNVTYCLPAWHAGIREGWVTYGTVYGDMHFKDILRSIARVGYCIMVPDFYLVLHGLQCQKKHSIGWSIIPTWLAELSLCNSLVCVLDHGTCNPLIGSYEVSVLIWVLLKSYSELMW